MPVPGNITFRFDTRQVTDRLKVLSRTLRGRATRQAMLNALEPMLQEAKARCPVDTGALRRGLLKQARTYADGMRVVGLVGPSRGRRKLKPGKTWRWAGPMRVTRYAHLVENGAPHHGPQPFLRPAYDHGVPRFPIDFGRELLSILTAMVP